MATPTVDFHFFDHGSIVTLTAATDAAKLWADDHLDPDRLTWGAYGSVIEPRYVDDILAGIRDADLVVQ